MFLSISSKLPEKMSALGLELCLHLRSHVFAASLSPSEKGKHCFFLLQSQGFCALLTLGRTQVRLQGFLHNPSMKRVGKEFRMCYYQAWGGREGS